MKKLIFGLLYLGISVMAGAQSGKYVNAMKASREVMDTSFKSPASLLTVANSFERIAVAEKDQWLPFYYAALCQVNAGFMNPDKSSTDAIADKASMLINKADSLSPGNSEISCIKSMIASCHLMVNPMERYMKYGAEGSAHLEKARQQDPSNPRPYYLIGQGLKYTPEKFGGGCKAAIEQLNIALQKFSSFKPATELSPAWGLERTRQLIKECQ